VKPIRILAAEDNEADVILFEEALAHHQLEHQLDVVRDGQAALGYLTRMGKPGQRPFNGRKVKKLMRRDSNMKQTAESLFAGNLRSSRLVQTFSWEQKHISFP
jgi:hypothetical protein